MPKYFVDSENINNNQIILDSEDVSHLTVIRKKAGDIVTVCDKNAMDYECEIQEISKKTAILNILEKYASKSEPNIKITLFQGLPKSDKMELIIQKCVELGVYEIVPVATKNAIVKLNENSLNKINRWQKISESAAKQCGRGIIPKIHIVETFQDALKHAASLDEVYIAYEKEVFNNPKEIFEKSKGKSIGIFIGPEGGFDPFEIEKCLKESITPISLGKRILRTETAGFMSIILLLFSRDAL